VAAGEDAFRLRASLSSSISQIRSPVGSDTSISATDDSDAMRLTVCRQMFDATRRATSLGPKTLRLHCASTYPAEIDVGRVLDVARFNCSASLRVSAGKNAKKRNPAVSAQRRGAAARKQSRPPATGRRRWWTAWSRDLIVLDFVLQCAGLRPPEGLFRGAYNPPPFESFGRSVTVTVVVHENN
jgi:hypothetical protein